MTALRMFAQLNWLLVLLILSATLFNFAFNLTTSAHNATRESFAAAVFEAISEETPNENMIFSPISIESCVLLAFFGASGETAAEMRAGLRLGTEPRKDVATKYGNFLRKAFQNFTKETELEMVNRIYLKAGLQVAPDFTKVALRVFSTSVQHVRFVESKSTANEINTWVAQHTRNNIKKLISENDIDGLTDAVLVNGIYFKGEWARPFNVSKTYKSDFVLNARQTVSVDMMRNKAYYNYAELVDFDATVLEMPYANSGVSMLLVLPNKVEGLQQLERILSSIELHELTSHMRRQEVKVFLPKFKIEFEVDLKQQLPKLGMTTMFSSEANFSRMLKTGSHMTISQAIQKAYLDVNEAGTEAAAATFIRRSTRSLNLQSPVYFRANHPFFFAIHSSQAVYFVGHLVKF